MIFMKENWEIKKLGEVGEIITGSTPKTSDNRNYSSNDYCFVKPSDFDNSIKELYNSEFFISEFAYNASRKLPINSVLVTCIGNIGNVAINKIECTTNQQINSIIPHEGINNKFLAYSVFAKKDYLQFIANAPVVPILNKTNFSNVEILIPPLPIQVSIVKELDILHRLKELQEQQLAEYDNLAQSTFYSMFGDPIENEKGWEMRRLGEVVKPKAEIKRANKEIQANETISYIDISSIDNFTNKITSFTEYVFSEAPSRAQQVVEVGDIVISLVRPNLNNVAILEVEYSNSVASSGFCVLRPSIIDLQFLFYIVKSDKFRAYLTARTAGANYPAVKEEDIKSFDLFYPPLSLQTAFAKRIEKIEAQKELVKQGIAETQLLIDYTMDKYFG